MKYRLKIGYADFTVVDGPMEGRSYRSGETYDEVPPQEKHKFETVEQQAGSPESRRLSGVESSRAVEQQPEDAVATSKEGGKKK